MSCPCLLVHDQTKYSQFHRWEPTMWLSEDSTLNWWLIKKSYQLLSRGIHSNEVYWVLRLCFNSVPNGVCRGYIILHMAPPNVCCHLNPTNVKKNQSLKQSSKPQLNLSLTWKWLYTSTTHIPTTQTQRSNISAVFVKTPTQPQLNLT